jgi:hypothetical protein
MNVLVPLRWPAYRPASQTVSELSAIGAPTQGLWVPLGIAYGLLVLAFGFGVWASAGPNRRLHVVGVLLIVYGVVCLTWPPMHLRDVLAAGGKTLTDTLHIVWTMATILLMLLAMSFGAASFGKTFRFYSIATMVTLAAFGGLTSMGAPGISANLPTPMIGVWERINIGVFLLWTVVLAVTCLRGPGQSNTTVVQ